ncbi:MAG TPA: hypothetical protein VGQ10_14905 [Vicinamibacterales bacterium]|nr:hypothetical protein [Vicinamibacterales bacterium]
MQLVRLGALAIFLITVPSSNGEASAAISSDASQHRRAARHDEVVLQWNDVALEAIRHSTLGPPMVARALAIVHTCMYDAWAAYDRVGSGTRFGVSLRRPRREHSPSHKREAVSVAAYRALVDLFPAQQALFDDLMARLEYDPLDTTTDPTTPRGVGNMACAAVLTFRHADRSNQLGDINGGAAYSDYTGYVPVNTPTQLNDPNRWQPITFADGRTPGFLAPHWGLVVPFVLPAGDALRPDPPALYPEGAYLRQAAAILRISAALTDRQKMIAEYWSDGPASELPPGHWNLLAQVVARRDRHSLDENVKLFFLLNNALFDASVAVWECKVFFDYVRPITAIRFLFGGQRVEAWGGPFQGTRIIDGKDWVPYQRGTFLTPPFAEYVSGHSTFSAASAEILKRFTGSDIFRHGVVLAPGSSRIEPGFTPRYPVVLYWPTFSAAAEQAGLSRRYGGIHFRDGDLEGRALGRRVATMVWEKAQRLFAGVDSPLTH